MVRIFICDDDTAERRKIENSLISYISARPDIAIDYDIFSSSFELLEETERSGKPDIILLDIFMPGMMGTELARNLGKLDGKTAIIFVTTSSDFALEAFSVHASDYICKPYTQEKFDSSLDRVIEVLGERHWILLSSEGKIHRVALEDIIYIETVDKRRVFVLSSGLRLPSWMSASELEKQVLVGKGIIKCGSSYIINFAHAKCFSANNLVMDNGALIPIPRRFKQTVKEQYFAYYTGEAKRNAGN